MKKLFRRIVCSIFAATLLVGFVVCLSACSDSRLGKYEYKDRLGTVLSTINAKEEHKCDVENFYYNGNPVAAKTGTFSDCYFNLDDDNVVVIKIQGVGYFGQLNGTTLSMSSDYGNRASSDYSKK